MTYLVTGGTGFIGRFLVERLAQRDGDIHVLVRASSVHKLDRLAAQWKAPAGKIKPVVGDLSEPMLGIDPAWIEEHTGKIEHVFHLAAVYDMEADEEANRVANVGGTREAVKVANALEAGHFHHTSSVAAAGLYRGEFTEDMFDEGQDLDHPYHATKFESERIAREETTVPWRVYRPAIVLGHSQTGEMDKLDGPYYFFKALALAARLPGVMPAIGPRLGETNVVPVDFVAAAMDHIAHEPGLDGQAFHLVSPEPQGSIEVLNIFARAAGAPTITSVLPKVSVPLALRVPGVKGVLLQQLGIPDAALEYVDFTARFDTTRTEAALAGSGISVPPLESYAPTLWRYWEQYIDGDGSEAPAPARDPHENPIRRPLRKANATFFTQVNKVVEWHRLPLPLALLNLRAFRDEMREANLYDPAFSDPPPENGAAGKNGVREIPKFRTYDGAMNDPAHPDMGKAGVLFGRNNPVGVSVPETPPRLMTPNPRLVATSLLERDEFKPATTLNALAAAWIQFQNHDWFSHGDNSPTGRMEVTLPEGDTWDRSGRMSVRTTADATQYVNTVTHWWDGSQIYGSSEERCRELRTGEGGKLAIEDGRLPNETKDGLDGIDLTGFSDNYWVGLSLLHTLFAKEHNAICDHLASYYPTWDDERLFLIARLVNSALMAKIHTVEWTPGILATPVLKRGMNANWFGALPEWAKTRLPRIDPLEGVFGIVGGEQEHHAAPYAITEEFASVYRLHPLIADDWAFRSHRTGALIREEEFTNLQGRATRSVVDEFGWSDVLYTFGVSNPGAITLHNHPRALMNLTRVNGDRVDIGTIDILRDRERGVLRYNAFRKKIGKGPLKRFEDITENQTWANEIRDIYDGDLDAIDLQVGLMAETPPKGFGFSDTAFRIFILMASRRLKSDRFFTNDYTPDVYTHEGIDWVARNTMGSVLLRHHPELAPALEGVENAFGPWKALA
ncbi:SDR family oxidoreductase [Paraconexibacter antarcticus]|uniref:SDR family oxidoreductase n=1 Tax=Paraconexibacter antarcticus TaxID=2949664 RepID=A0ABY5DPV8_9ACTN|nr:peroxidase family protein [Paraconexibacter antarcticus]UTI64073.1 SDR family oxidoreductase [Paraconexibacter antarcticus]